MSLISALDPLHPNDFFLFVANDNDFISGATKMIMPDGTLATFDATNGGASPVNDTMFLAYRVTLDGLTPVPEPATYGAIAGNALLLLILWRRYKARS
jgi:hypothetical protein